MREQDHLIRAELFREVSVSGDFRLGTWRGRLQISFEGEKFSLVPASGAAITFDLAAVDKIRPAEWEFELDLYTEKRVLLRQFGAAFSRMCGELIAAWRDRTVAALLLEDLEEVARYEGAAALNGAPPEPAEIRIFKTNLAVLPKAGVPFQWRVADVDSIAFDEPAWAFQLARGNERLALSKFAKKTEEFGARLRAAFDELRQRSAEALRERFLFLDPDSLAQLADLLREGRSVAMRKLGEIDPRLPEAIVSRAVDATLRPYFDWLRDRAGAGLVMTGFKFIRADEEQPEPDASPEEKEAETDALFFWFFFPIGSANLVAWEAVTGSGRTTYFFRLPPNVNIEEYVQRLTRALALINFRREPVYLPDHSLEEQPRFYRYAIAARKIPDLRTLRADYVGRAIHSSFDAWKSQAEAILSGSAERGSATQGRV